MSRRLSSASFARLAAKAADATPSASPRARLPLASLAATSILASVSIFLLKASASAWSFAHSAWVLELTSRCMERILEFSLDTSRFASVMSFWASTVFLASISAMSLDVCATTWAVSLIARFFTTSACCSAAIRMLSHSSRSLLRPSSWLSFCRSKPCFMCCMFVLESKRVFSSKSAAISLGKETVLTVKCMMRTPYLFIFVSFISSMMCCVLVPCKSLMSSTFTSMAICRRDSSCAARRRSSSFCAPML
mmetsp:Transcript_117274/g.365192  ORF Transcript_117274/g.365192 Transcript_117274/m.365192 type:complete len:250 (+) Transcript_117274:588-1337(+)